MTCEVCEGALTYPVIDKYGQHRYSITCPECLGSGESVWDDEETGTEAQAPQAGQSEAEARTKA